jgi:hypothetical protein
MGKMTVVDERPCGYCGAKAGQDCHGYGLIPGDIHMARIRPELADRRLSMAAYDLLQAAEAALAELVLLDQAPNVRRMLTDAIRMAKEDR